MNYEKLDSIIQSYKDEFQEYRKGELYKWKAIKTFQDNWNIEAENFEEMIKASLKGAGNLLTARNFFPGLMIMRFAEREPEATREMFRVLFDENKNLNQRYDYFINKSNEILFKYWEKEKHHHYQDAHSVSTYLTFMYPEKYYIYKANADKEIARFLDVDINKTNKNGKLKAFFDFADDVLEYIEKDKELLSLSKSSLDEESYQDEKFHMLTCDLLFFGGVKLLREKKEKHVENKKINVKITHEGIDDKYTDNDFLNDIYVEEKSYRTLCHLLDRKKNVILNGPPGVGKSYMAKRLAYSLIGKKDGNRVKYIQFHQSYSYEDFLEGWRPNGTSYKLEKGIFYVFCKEAEKYPDKKYYLIIDEINRGNLSKIFGEILTLIEHDKREEKMDLMYSKERFSVPKNVYIIATMNTADRSLVNMDYAFKRRFEKFPVRPAFENEKFKEYQAKINNKMFDKLINLIKQLNNDIEKDPTLGQGFEIGHSYFCNFDKISEEDIEEIIEFEILPLIEDYWFDDVDKYNNWANRLRGIMNDRN